MLDLLPPETWPQRILWSAKSVQPTEVLGCSVSDHPEAVCELDEVVHIRMEADRVS